ncbi:hypothetical protein GCM10020001_060510 [Nonomuraea salmonea]
MVAPSIVQWPLLWGAHGQLVDHEAARGLEHLDGQQPGHAQLVGDLQADVLGPRGRLGVEVGGGRDDLDADAVLLHGLDDGVADALPVGRAGDQHGHLTLERDERLGHQLDAGRERLGDLFGRAAHPHAAPVVAAAYGLEHDRPAVGVGEGGGVAGGRDPPPGGAGHADRAEPLAHDRLVLGVHEGFGAGPHGVAVGDQGLDVLGGDVLVVERDDVAALRERPEHLKIAIVSDARVDDDPGRALLRSVGQHPQLDTERDGGRLRHPGELARADDADDRSDGADGTHVRRAYRDATLTPPGPGPSGSTSALVRGLDGRSGLPRRHDRPAIRVPSNCMAA